MKSKIEKTLSKSMHYYVNIKYLMLIPLLNRKYILHKYPQGPSISYVVSRGRVVKNCQFYLVKRQLRGERGSKVADFETTQFMNGPLKKAGLSGHSCFQTNIMQLIFIFWSLLFIHVLQSGNLLCNSTDLSKKKCETLAEQICETYFSCG